MALGEVNCGSWRGQLVPQAEEYIKDITTRKEHFIIRQSTSSKAQDEGLHERHEVDIEKKDYTCVLWQLSGLTCIHSAAFIEARQHILWYTYADDHYYLYKMAYDGAISTLPRKDLWAVVSDGELVTMQTSLRPCGKPKKRRIKNFLEIGKKTKLGHMCSGYNL
ncbi:hypothetical protein MA16_Dca010660 [Dendrobium catenatum]|uniref:SWIM-type domain-containing protein n=1 Tax=Dendrobium catenatum TaxID=906689 RepID=A0A2I0VZT3_9ASPA|nr:hypothetical protein MA16_Dca010660 [Dendrobium catenatum]